jgi:hypothetical protein
MEAYRAVRYKVRQASFLFSYIPLSSEKEVIKISKLSWQSSHMAVRLSAPRIRRDLLPRNINFLFLELISITGWVHPKALYGMNDFANCTFIRHKGSRRRDLPAGTIEPYPLRYRTPQFVCVNGLKKSNLFKKVIIFCCTTCQNF